MSENGQSNSRSAQPSAAEKPRARLCYVDDSRTAAFVVRRMLEPNGFQVDYFQSAEPAVVALIQNDYDLLLTDLKVSSTGMDGDDLIRTLRQSGQSKLSQLPIIVITGSTDAEVLVKVYDAGANQVMTKPVDADALQGHINRLLFTAREGKADAPVPQAQSVQGPVSLPAEKSADVPLILPISTSNSDAPADNEKHIPLLKTADSLATQASMNTTTLADATAADSVSEPFAEPTQGTAPTAEEPMGVIERAVAAHEQAAADQSGAVSEPPPVVDEFEDYDGEVEVIIDPEQSSGRKRRGRANAYRDEDDILYEINQFAQDDEVIRSADSQRNWFSARTLLILVLLLSLGFAGFKGWQFYSDRGLAVSTRVVEMGEIYQSLVVPGHVVSQQQVEIRAAREGRLVAIAVDEGASVEAGQLLVRQDNRELLTHLKRVQADMASAREDISLAERTLARLRAAYEKGAVAKRFVDDAEVRLRAARVRAGVAAENAHSASLELEKQEIKAPFRGMITQRKAEIGQWVTPADVLFVLADESQREIEVHVDTADSAGISVGQVVLMTSDAFPGLEWQETVVRVSTVAEKQRNSNWVKIFISLGAQAPNLRFGQQVDAEIRTAWNPNAIKVPFEALLTRNKQMFVAVLKDDEVHLKPVVSGIEDFSMAEILQGLEVGEIIILPRGQPLQDGDRVYALDSKR